MVVVVVDGAAESVAAGGELSVAEDVDEDPTLDAPPSDEVVADTATTAEDPEFDAPPPDPLDVPLFVPPDVLCPLDPVLPDLGAIPICP